MGEKSTMNILSHRGYWKEESEKNQTEAFERSFSLDFGVETDIRDYKGELVISHDIANENCIKLEVLLELYNTYGNRVPIALNIKSDGLQKKLKKILKEYKVENYFVFDMSVPDGLLYIKNNVKLFTRQSEYEEAPSIYEGSSGVWLDEFKSHWITKEIIQKHISNGKEICIVSPELHKREYKKEWLHYKKIENELCVNNLMICTDNPEEAKDFFNE